MELTRHLRRLSFCSVFQLRLALALALLGWGIPIEPAAASVHTWTGAGANGLWTTAANWSGGAPTAGEIDARLVFPPGASRLNNTNNIDNLALTTITLSGTGYRLAGTGNGTNLILKTVVLSNGPVVATITASGTTNTFLSSLDLVLGVGPDTVTFNVADSTDTLRIDGTLSGPGGFKKEGQGTLILAGGENNRYQAKTLVRAGTLRLDQSRAIFVPTPIFFNYVAIPGDLDILADLGAAQVLYDASSQIANTANVFVQKLDAVRVGTLDLQGYSDEIRSLRGSGLVNFDGGTLTVDQEVVSNPDPNQSRTFTGLLNAHSGVSPVGTLVKRGSGELRLEVDGTGTSFHGTFSQLRIEDGLVNLRRPASNAVVQVLSPGAVLAGTTVAPQLAYAQAISLEAGELRPGSAGLLSPNPLYAGHLSMNTGSVFRAVLRSSANYSRIVVVPAPRDGRVILANPTLEVSCDFIAPLNQSFTVIDKVSSGAISGTFRGLPEGASFVVGGRLFRITYQGGDGNDVVLTRILSLAEFPPSLPMPVLSRDGGGAPVLVLSVNTVANQLFSVETNSNLANPRGWGLRVNLSANDAGQLVYIDRDVGLFPQLFYRFKAVLPPVPTGPWNIPLSQVPSNLLAAAQQHLTGFFRAGEIGDAEDANWWDAVIAPTAIQLYDPAYQNGATPAYVELKITSRSRGGLVPQPVEDRGFLLLSLTPNDRPIVEFATVGETEAERVLRRAQGAGIHKLMRFSSTFMAAEGDDGRLLASFGTTPRLPAGPVPTTQTRYTSIHENETGTHIHPSNAFPAAVVLSNYTQLRVAWATDPVVAAVRDAQARRIQPSWRRINGLRPAALRVAVGETRQFGLSEFFASARLDIDPEEIPIASVQALPNSGFEVTGLRPGEEIVRTLNKAGLETQYRLTVTPAAGAGLDDGMFMAADCVAILADQWVAGQGWDHDQPHYYQFEHDNWCQFTGCGPVALSMLAAWWDIRGVRSAFYKLTPSTTGLANLFRFNFDSLVTKDAPIDLGESEVFRNYDDFHELCNVTCEVISGAGSTLPEDLSGAWGDYINRIGEPWPFPQDEFGQEFVNYSWRSSWNYPFTDWEDGGTYVATGIKRGRPGVVGIGWWGDEHYALAYVYKKSRRYEGCGSDRELDEVSRYFKCNMGWGGTRKWKNAENVWLGLTANIGPRNTPAQ